MLSLIGILEKRFNIKEPEKEWAKAHSFLCKDT